MLVFASGTQQSVMSDSDKAFWWYMHKKSADEFNSGNRMLLPSAFFTIIFYIITDSIFIHTDESVIADGNSMCILAEVVNDRLCTIEGFLAMRNPFFFITGIQQFFESIMIAIFFTTSMKLKLLLIPQAFQLIHIFTTKQL